MSRFSSLKAEVVEALLAADFDRVAQLAAASRRVFTILISLAYDKESLITWRGIEAIGPAVGALAGSDPGAARDIVHRLLWSVTEESGAIGWSAPEMLAEIVAGSPGSFQDVVPIIPSFFEEPPLRPGVLWALGRLAAAGVILPAGAGQIVAAGLKARDPAARGMAVWAVGCLGLKEMLAAISSLTTDPGRFMLYRGHELVNTGIGDLAGEVSLGLQAKQPPGPPAGKLTASP